MLEVIARMEVAATLLNRLACRARAGTERAIMRVTQVLRHGP